MHRQKIMSEIPYICLKRDGEMIREARWNLKEFSLQIFVNDEYLLTSVCTDEYIEELVLGRLKTDGIIEFVSDVLKIQIDDGKAYVTVTETKKRIEPAILPKVECPNEWVFVMADRMADGMPYHNETWATHSCFLYSKGELLFMCEDLGRHNAMDKVIGYAIKNEIRLSECAVYTSGRVPSDMAMKAIMAGIPVLISKGMPTQDTIELVNEYQLTLISGARRDLVRIYADFRKKGVDALILAGGKSSRMGGQHKGNLICENETFVQRLINEMTKISDQILLSYGNTIHTEDSKCKIVQDIYADCGPIGGIHAGLNKAENEKVIIVACDMPFMRAEFFDKLAEMMTETTDVIVPVVDGRIHPLAAIYKKRVLPAVETQILSGNYRLRHLLDQLHTEYVDVSDDTRMAEMLKNINTVEEYYQI